MKSTSLLAGFLAGAAVLLVGCSKPADQPDPKWTSPIAISSSMAGLGGSARLVRYQDTLIAIQVHRDNVQIRELNRAKISWMDLSAGNVTSDYLWYCATIAPQSGRILVPESYAENEQVVMKALMGTLMESGGLRDITETKWVVDKQALLRETGASVRLNESGRRSGVGLGQGILSELEGFIPFSLYAETSFGFNNVSNGPFANGVFHTADSGKTWEMDKIANFNSYAPKMCRTDGHYYYFGIGTPVLGRGVWSSRKPSSGRIWDAAAMIAEKFAYVFGHYDVAGAGNTAHLCWMDRRHNKFRFNFDGPPIENNDIYYRRREDGANKWDKEVWLSKGLMYCYAPSISAEGSNVVVVWAGIKAADKQHTDMGPNDIYYVASVDGGKTWTLPQKVTDVAKDGITCGLPQVMLLNGVIHLLYTQGATKAPDQLAPGLIKLGVSSWPIYYTQRPFPN